MEFDLENEIVIQDSAWRPVEIFAEGQRIDTLRPGKGWHEALPLIREWMKDNQVWLDVLYVNERGHVDLCDPNTGEFIEE